MSELLTNLKTHQKQREHKGKSLLSFPSDYVVIDIETTGLDPKFDEIIELSAIRYVNNVKESQFSSLIKPKEPISNFISDLTGITNDMVSDADSIETVLPRYLSFIGDSSLVGHNIHFDINFIYDCSMDILNKPFSNDFSDILRLSRRLMPNSKNHKLSTLAKELCIDTNGMHRALMDCEIANSIYQHCKDVAVSLYGSVDSFVDHVKDTSSGAIKVKDITTSNTHFDESNPIYGKVFVFTGVLEKMVRRDAMQIVVDYGGINGNSVTKETNYLVLGNNDYCKSIKDGKSTKHKKAESYKLSGQDIEIIPENVFYDMIDINLLPSASVKSSDAQPKASDIFNEEEISVFHYIRELLEKTGRDISLVRYSLKSDKSLSISNFYELLRIKLRGRTKYFVLPNNFDASSYDLSFFEIKNTSSGDRYVINDVSDLSHIENLICALFDSINESVEIYRQNVASAERNIKTYFKTTYC